MSDDYQQRQQAHQLHEDNKASSKYFWMLNHAWEREKALDQFSFNVVKLFTLLNSTSIGGVLAIILQNSEILEPKRDIILKSFMHWTFGLTAAFVCFILWYCDQASSINSAEETYEHMISQQEGAQNNQVSVMRKLWAFLVICCGIATGTFFIIGAWNLALNII